MKEGKEGTEQPRRNTYDVIVVGSGIGGTTAGALLAKAGLSVLVAEQGDGPGGYAHAFHRGPYVLDPAVHLIGDESLFDGLLRHLEVRDACTFLHTDVFYTARFPGLTFHAPLGGVARFVDAHVAALPQQERSIRAFWDLCVQIHREAHTMPARLSLRDLDGAVDQSPVLFKYRRATLGDVLREVFDDHRAANLCAAGSTILGLAPSRLPFQMFAQLVLSYVTHQGFYCQGGAQGIVGALVSALQSCGSELVVRNRVRQILVQEGRARGVVLSDGREILAPIVISNAAVPQTFGDLVAPAHLPEPFLKKIGRMRPSISGFLLLAATRLDLRQFETSHQVFPYENWDVEEVFARTAAARETPPLAFFHPSLVDGTLAPPGEHLALTSMFRPYDVGIPWAQERERCKSMVLRALETAYPGFQEALVFADTATPETLLRFTLNTGGAIYGWENSLEHIGSKRPAQRTPVAGLYLAGHWTHPGSGFLRAAVSGMLAARLALAEGGNTSHSPFAHPSLPPL